MSNTDIKIFITPEEFKSMKKEYQKAYYKNKTEKDPEYKKKIVEKNKEYREQKRREQLAAGILPKKRGPKTKYEIVDVYDDSN